MASLLVGVGPSVPMASQFSSLSFSHSQSPAAALPFSLTFTSILIPNLSHSPFHLLWKRGQEDCKRQALQSLLRECEAKEQEKRGEGPPRVPTPPAPPRKDRYDDGEVVKIEIDESLG